MSVTTPARRYEDNEPPDAENTNNINDQDLHDKSFDDDFYAEMTNGKRRCLDGSSTGDDTCRGISDLGRAMQDDDDDDLHDFEDDWDSDPYEWESEQEVYKVRFQDILDALHTLSDYHLAQLVNRVANIRPHLLHNHPLRLLDEHRATEIQSDLKREDSYAPAVAPLAGPSPIVSC
ncbi:hypothetical protein FOZ62_030467 [Perkinsus olseni]|uniref:Uncharacterized protein n=1 Tax=Perkinsus olseni TaxID=32597 RepID=A0A7J6UEM8_PEROL|nr:hypothetical protein FOZ62_030467 [Perkinsus olseni]